MKIQWELDAASRRSRLIAEEGKRRVLGLSPKPYPKIRKPKPGVPGAMLLVGVLGVLFFWPPLARSMSVQNPTQSPIANVRATVSAVTTNVQTSVRVRERPSTTSRIIGGLAPRTPVEVLCWVDGEPVTRGTQNTARWHRLAAPRQGWVSAAYMQAESAVSQC